MSRTVKEIINVAVTDEVNRRLNFNVAAYGKPWTGEYADTEFLCAGAADAVVKALMAEGVSIGSTQEDHRG